MACFVKIPDFRIGKPGQWILVDELVYRSHYLAKNKDLALVVVPKGFTTDLASIPKLVPRWLIDVNNEHRLPAVVHDYLCHTARTRKERIKADHVFLEAMKLEGVVRWRRWAMFSAVRLMTQVKRFPK